MRCILDLDLEVWILSVCITIENPHFLIQSFSVLALLETKRNYNSSAPIKQLADTVSSA